MYDAHVLALPGKQKHIPVDCPAAVLILFYYAEVIFLPSFFHDHTPFVGEG